MNPRSSRNTPSRSGAALIHRGPQALIAPHVASANFAPAMHAPNAALLIDFDNVTMGIRSDLGKELRTLLGSDIIKGKVAVQRAYADWRRYPQYIVPLAESSIDMIMAPAYGSSKKNATDIRLAVDAMEIVFTRPEIGTYILLSGDSDFASLVTKLKEYGKYVIGVGIRESSSDLLVMNCDEYYSYNALAGLVKTSEEEPAKKWDPWELVTEAVNRMKRNGDVMRSDRLKQVMQEIDSSFDEKDLGMSKFSRFVQDAVQRGLISATKLENGQLEIGLPGERAAEPAAETAPKAEAAVTPGEDRKSRGRRGRRGRGGRDREDRPRPEGTAEPTQEPKAAAAPETTEQVGTTGERLTRDEAFDLMRRAVNSLTSDDTAVRASVVRARARELLGRDSESLSDRNFPRILKDAHDHDVIDLRRSGDDFEIARAAAKPPATESAAATTGVAASPTAPTAPPRGMAPRGVAGSRARSGRPGPLPPELLSIGVVGPASTTTVSAPTVVAEPKPKSAPAAKRGRGKGAAKTAPVAEAITPAAADTKGAKPARKRAAAKAPRAKKAGGAKSHGAAPARDET
ncbi:MAG TPA: NYN domain-containing protein [Gemmatimonadaceae bacterium]